MSIPREVYTDEYAAAPITERLTWPTEPLQTTSLADQLLPARPLPLIATLLLIAAGAVKLGWEARGLFGPVYDNRGWAALLVFSIVGSIYMVNYCNRRGVA